LPWQTDTCIGHWHYDRSVFDHHSYKKAADVIPMLVDIVSKNGNLLLNIPVRGDGTIDEDEVAFLKEMARWTAVNGEGIFSTRPWKVFGEGPSTAPVPAEGNRHGGQSDVAKTPFTAEDIRFTASKDGKTLYAILLGWPANGQIAIKSLAAGTADYTDKIGDVQLLGSKQKLVFSRDTAALTVTLPAEKPCDTAYVLKITPAS
jgi:alpha-L-fucosidase